MQKPILRQLGLMSVACSLACTAATTDATHDYGDSAIILSAPAIAGAGTINVTVSLHDSNGKAVSGAAVQVSIDGLTVVQVSSITDANGDATASVVNPTAVGQHTVTASVTAGSKQTNLTATSSLQVLSPITANGNDVATGVPLNVQAAAFANNVLNTGYTGTVAVTSTDSSATLPANYTFTADDHGVKLWKGGVTFQKPGAQTVTVTDTASGTVLGKQTFQVAAQAVGTLVWTTLPQTPAVAGSAFSATLTVQDASGHAITNYQRQVSFASSDANAVVPASVTFAASDAGVKTVQFTLKTAGSQSITASDAAVSSSPGDVTVTAAAAATLTATAGANFAAGAANSVQIKAYDAYGNLATGYRGTVGFTSTESGVSSLPDNYTFTATDAGQHNFANVVFCSVGSATVTATDTVAASLRGVSANIAVGAGTATRLRVTTSNPNWAAGDATNSVTVEGVDDCDNIVPAYTAIGGFTSSDPTSITQLSQVAWQISANGETTVTDPELFLTTAGTQTLTATDAVLNFAGQANITVLPGDANSFRVSFNESPAFVAHLNPVTVDTLDAYGNVTPNYVGGTVELTSTDSNTLFPGAVAVTSAAAGHATLGDANFLYYGHQQVTASDGTIHGNANITVHQVRQLASHLGFTVCATMDDGSEMKCWGHLSDGEGLSGSSPSLGQSPNDMGPNLPLSSLGTGIKADKIYTGQSHNCLIHKGAQNDPNNGKVKCWGINDHGQLGLGDVNPRGALPSQIGDNLPFVDLGTGRTAVSMALGQRHSCAILDTGKLVCWGFNDDGELGIDNPNSVGKVPGQMGDNLVPVILGTGRTAVEASAGGYHSCALMDDHNVKCWAFNNDGESGTGNPNYQLGFNPGEMENDIIPIDFGGGHKAVHIASGQFHNCVILDDGSVKCWGYVGNGEAGSKPTTGNNVGKTGVQVADFPVVPFESGRTAVQIAMGFQHSCALLDNGEATCWGYNADGELGLNDPNARGWDIPFNGAGINLGTDGLGTNLTVREVRAGGYHTCASLSNGTVKCWGYNGDGQSGIGVTTRGIGNDPNTNAPDAMGDALPSISLY